MTVSCVVGWLDDTNTICCICVGWCLLVGSLQECAGCFVSALSTVDCGRSVYLLHYQPCITGDAFNTQKRWPRFYSGLLLNWFPYFSHKGLCYCVFTSICTWRDPFIGLTWDGLHRIFDICQTGMTWYCSNMCLLWFCLCINIQTYTRANTCAHKLSNKHTSIHLVIYINISISANISILLPVDVCYSVLCRLYCYFYIDMTNQSQSSQLLFGQGQHYSSLEIG